MKLSFSTKGWRGVGWEDFCRMAQEFGFAGIELHDPEGMGLTGPDGPFFPGAANRTVRALVDRGLRLACVDALCDLAQPGSEAACVAEIRRCLDMARRFRIPFIRLHAAGEPGDEAAEARVRGVVFAVLREAEDAGVVLLMETYGIYADTSRLRELLNGFASDGLAALWDLQHPCRLCGESAQDTITNLGAYVRHVHVKDSVSVGGAPEYRLMGEGDLPLADMMDALRSVNYDGFISLEWDPDWQPELSDPEILFPQFAGYMSRFDDPSRGRSSLYYSQRGDGRYVWKKDDVVDLTFPQVLDRMVEEFPDQYCFKYTTLDYTRTYAEFKRDVDAFAKSLIALGVKRGDKVAIWATNVPAWFITFWATTEIGAVLVTVNTAYKIHEAEYLLRQSDTHTLVMVEGYRDSDYAGIMRSLCPEIETATPGKPLHCRRLPFLRNIITVGFRMPGCLTWEEAAPYAERVGAEELRRRIAAVRIHDVANMQYTSGTTGFPKGVMLTHHNVVNNGKYIGDHMDLSTADRMMIQVPMFHCFGMVLSMTASMTHGTTMCPLPYFSPKSALACIRQEHITTFNGVPTMFIAMMEHEDFAKTDFSYIRTGIMAGSNCPAELMRRAADVMNMKQIVSVYGQTEASPGCTMSSFDDPLDVRTETVGSRFANVECRIVDPNTGEDCPIGVSGEFIARGYNIMKGYYKMPEATAAAVEPDGWLHTGDLACEDENGNFRITGRLKDMIIRGGENIYPKEIEEFLYTCPKISDVQVIGVPDRQYGEEIMACVVLKEGETMTEAELKDFVRAHMAKHKVPRYVRFVDGFPMNAAGKILKYKMREEAVELLGLDKEV